MLLFTIFIIVVTQTSSSAVQIRHSKVYGNPIASSFYSISPCIFPWGGGCRGRSPSPLKPPLLVIRDVNLNVIFFIRNGSKILFGQVAERNQFPFLGAVQWDGEFLCPGLYIVYILYIFLYFAFDTIFTCLHFVHFLHLVYFVNFCTFLRFVHFVHF